MFVTDTKNKIWVGNITYIPTSKGTLYFAVFIDIFSRKVAGWSMGSRIKDTLVIETFIQAYGKEQPNCGLIVHTNQCSQYTGGNFRTIIVKYGAIHSNSRRGNTYENTVMEFFYRTIKREFIQDAHFATPEQAQKEIFKYIELYYNTKRIPLSVQI